MAGLFQVLYGKPDGTFRKAEVLKGTDGEPLIIPVRSKPGKGDDWANGICTRPFAVDWDGDGHLDLVVGTLPGKFYLFKGQGRGKFLPKPEEMKAGDRPLKFEGYHGDPFVVDWDGDGDLDILSGSSEGGVQWAENRAGPGKPPRLEPFRVLIEHGPTLEYGADPPRFGPQGAAQRHADLGRRRQCRREARYPGRRPGALISPADGLSEQEFKKRLAEWMKTLGEASEKLHAISKDDEKERPKAQQRIQDLFQQQSQFMKDDRTGFIWLYLRK